MAQAGSGFQGATGEGAAVNRGQSGNSEPDSTGSDSGSDHSATTENVVVRAISRIKDEPLLFLIAVIALLVGVVVYGAKLASADLRFVILVIAVLAFLGVITYYFARAGGRSAGLATGKGSKHTVVTADRGGVAAGRDIQGGAGGIRTSGRERGKE